MTACGRLARAACALVVLGAGLTLGAQAPLPQQGLIVRPQFDDAREFSEGLAPVKIGNRWGFVDRSGKLVVGAIYTDVTPFSEGTALVDVNGRRGFVNATGQMAIPARYEQAWSFTEGLAAVAVNSRYGYIDRTGATVIPFQYCFASKFSGGLASVTTGDSCYKGKSGYIDKTGKLVIRAQFGQALMFSEGLASVQPKIGGKWGFIDTAGKMKIAARFDGTYAFSDGLAPVKLGLAWGFVDTSGAMAVPHKYTAAGPFSNGLAPVQDGTVWKYIDKKGRVVIDEAASPELPSEGLIGVSRPGGWGYMTQDGTLAIAPRYQGVRPFREGAAAVKIGGKWGYIDRSTDGPLVLPTSGLTVAVEPQEPAWGVVATGVKDESGIEGAHDRVALLVERRRGTSGPVDFMLTASINALRDQNCRALEELLGSAHATPRNKPAPWLPASWHQVVEWTPTSTEQIACLDVNGRAVQVGVAFLYGGNLASSRTFSPLNLVWESQASNAADRDVAFMRTRALLESIERAARKAYP